MLRIPKQLLDPRPMRPYCLDERTKAWTTSTHLVLDLRSDDEEHDGEESAEDSLAAIVGIRAELAAGDLRALYLAWLSALAAWELDEDDEDKYQQVREPPVPAGLTELTAPQRALADFLRVDPDLLAVAAEASTAAPATPPPATARQLAPLVAAMPGKEKDVVRLALGREPNCTPNSSIFCAVPPNRPQRRVGVPQPNCSTPPINTANAAGSSPSGTSRRSRPPRTRGGRSTRAAPSRPGSSRRKHLAGYRQPCCDQKTCRVRHSGGPAPGPL
jgi:hypothetical protein